MGRPRLGPLGRGWWVPALLAAGLVAWGALIALARTDGEGQEGAPQRPLRIAVVEMDALFERSAEWADFQDRQRRLLQRMRRTLKKHEDGLAVLRNEYENLPPGSREAREKRAQIEESLRAYRASRDQFERQATEARAEALRSLLRGLESVIRHYAREHELDLVLKRQTMELGPDKSVAALMRSVSSEVLYAHERLSITRPVLERLNASYQGEITDR